MLDAWAAGVCPKDSPFWLLSDHFRVKTKHNTLKRPKGWGINLKLGILKSPEHGILVPLLLDARPPSPQGMGRARPLGRWVAGPPVKHTPQTTAASGHHQAETSLALRKREGWCQGVRTGQGAGFRDSCSALPAMCTHKNASHSKRARVCTTPTGDEAADHGLLPQRRAALQDVHDVPRRLGGGLELGRGLVGEGLQLGAEGVADQARGGLGVHHQVPAGARKTSGGPNMRSPGWGSAFVRPFGLGRLSITHGINTHGIKLGPHI